MKCPYCSCPDSRVLDKRETEDGQVTRRRRECLDCGKRFTTYERVEVINLRIIKKDSSREQFDREKLLAGIKKACEKRPVSAEQIEKVVDDIEADLLRKDTIEISSRVIGELIMKKLKKLDKVAYIRFASVYREFTDLESFKEEVNRLLKKK